MSSPGHSPRIKQRSLEQRSPKGLDNESLISRLIFALLIFLSFFLSLFLVDTYATSERRRMRETSPIGGRAKRALSALLWKPRPESPYADVGGPRNEEEAWVWHTKQRKMLRMEVTEAFELRRWVVVGMGVLAVLIGIGWWYFGAWAWKKRGTK